MTASNLQFVKFVLGLSVEDKDEPIEFTYKACFNDDFWDNLHLRHEEMSGYPVFLRRIEKIIQHPVNTGFFVRIENADGLKKIFLNFLRNRKPNLEIWVPIYHVKYIELTKKSRCSFEYDILFDNG